MKPYLDLLKLIMDDGVIKKDRTGTGTKSIFGHQMRFNLAKGFPLVTTKKIHMKSVIYELLWFLQGSTNVRYLNENGVSIWDEWADQNGELGPVYGKQWRSWESPEGKTIDQITNLIDMLKKNPDSRRLIVSAWNVADIEKMKLPPCHLLFQFYTRDATQMERITYAHNRGTLVRSAALQIEIATGTDDEALEPWAAASGAPTKVISCQLYQRSCDTLLGVPFNIASYALLTMMIAQCVNMIPGEFVWTGGDTHIYSNHFDQVAEQLTREPKELPKMIINPEVKDIFSFKYEDFKLENYNPHPAIKAPIAV